MTLLNATSRLKQQDAELQQQAVKLQQQHKRIRDLEEDVILDDAKSKKVCSLHGYNHCKPFLLPSCVHLALKTRIPSPTFLS